MDIRQFNIFQSISFAAMLSILFVVPFNDLVNSILLKYTYTFFGIFVAVLSCIFLGIYWYSYIKKTCSLSTTRSNLEREFLMNALRSVETSKIPYVVDRFLELDRAGERNEGQENSSCQVPVDRRCVVCLHSEARIRTLPCNHRVVCGWCAWQSLKICFNHGAPHRCVICRTEIEDFTGSLIKNLMNIKWKDVRKIVDEIKQG